MVTVLLFCLLALRLFTGAAEEEFPEVLISTLLMRKSQILPHFLDRLQRLNYPKSKIHLWIRCDEIDGDSTCDIANWWKNNSKLGKEYADIDLLITKTDWTLGHPYLHTWIAIGNRRMNRVMDLRQESLEICRRKGISWLFSLDGDVLFSDFDVIGKLMKATLSKREVGIIVPFLIGENLDSTFLTLKEPFEDITEVEESTFLDIVTNHLQDQELRGVEFVHSAVLIFLGHPNSHKLSFHTRDLLPLKENSTYKLYGAGDFVSLSITARNAGIKMVCLREEKHHGHVVARQFFFKTPAEEIEAERFVKMATLNKGPNYELEEFEKAGFTEDFPQPSPLPRIDRVFVINLKKRPEKMRRMDYLLKHLGVNYTRIEAIDGGLLRKDHIKGFQIGLPPFGYADIYSEGRRHLGITQGLVGLTLTEVLVWSTMHRDEQLKAALILEDDCKFVFNFRQELDLAMEEMVSYDPEWDLLYLGRKVFEEHPDTPLTSNGNQKIPLKKICKPGYSHWTIALVLSRAGAMKLLEGKPLKYILPIDEYIPLMAGAHFDKKLTSIYPQGGSLNVYGLHSHSPIVSPMKFSHEVGYITDTDSYRTTLPLDWFVNAEELNVMAKTEPKLHVPEQIDDRDGNPAEELWMPTSEAVYSDQLSLIRSGESMFERPASAPQRFPNSYRDFEARTTSEIEDLYSGFQDTCPSEKCNVAPKNSGKELDDTENSVRPTTTNGCSDSLCKGEGCEENLRLNIKETIRDQMADIRAFQEADS